MDWDISIKEQLELMSQALRDWRRNVDHFSNDSPYGTNWDFFSFGHCLEVLLPKPRVDPYRVTLTEKRNRITFTLTIRSSHQTN